MFPGYTLNINKIPYSLIIIKIEEDKEKLDGKIDINLRLHELENIKKHLEKLEDKEYRKKIRDIKELHKDYISNNGKINNQIEYQKVMFFLINYSNGRIELKD